MVIKALILSITKGGMYIRRVYVQSLCSEIFECLQERKIGGSIKGEGEGATDKTEDQESKKAWNPSRENVSRWI